jgi:small subunit ribosomal protein S16
MAVKIRLSRKGKRHKPFYHVVVADGRMPRDGRFLEVLGTYDPSNKEHRFTGKKERIEHWIENGALPSETVSHLIRSL